MRFAALLFLAAFVSTPGCLDGVFVVKAASPLVLTSYGYDGVGGRELEGTLNATLYETRDKGTIEATYRDAVHGFHLTWVNFTGSLPYQSGGVSGENQLFGDTGNGSTALPRLTVYAAAWGTVEYFIDDVRQPDPHSLFQTMDAVFFVSRGTYRDNETRIVGGAQPDKPYDPNRPDESTVDAIGSMAVLQVFTKRGDLYRLLEFSDVAIVAS